MSPEDGLTPRRPRAIYFELLVSVGIFVIPAAIGSLHAFLRPQAWPAGDVPIRMLAMAIEELLAVLLVVHLLKLHGEGMSTISVPVVKNDAWRALALVFASAVAGIVIVLVLYAGAPRLFQGQEETAPSLKFLEVPITIPYVLFVLINPVAEEVLVRGFLQTRLSQAGWRPAVIVVFSAAVQAFYHLYQGVPAMVMHFGEFLVFAGYYQKTRRLGAVVGAHAMLNICAMLAMSMR